MKLLLVLILVVVCAWSSGAQNIGNVYCGRQLANMISSICWEEGKRDSGWWVSPDAARALGGLRGKRGPVDECCDKPCTIEELRTYCPRYE